MKSLCSELGLQRIDREGEWQTLQPASQLVLRFGAAEAASAQEARDFDDLSSTWGEVAHIHISHLPASWLDGVKVWHGQELVYCLDSVVCPKGLPVSAGEMIQAMAHMAGDNRLALDLRSLGLRASQITVVLFLLPPAAALARSVSVSLLAD